MLKWESLIKDIRFKFSPETGKSWNRINIIRQTIPKGGSVKSITVIEAFFFYLCTDG